MARRTNEGETVTELIYRNQLNDMELMENSIFEVQGRHLKEYNQELYYQFIYFPAEMIVYFDYVIHDLYSRFFIDQSNSDLERL